MKDFAAIDFETANGKRTSVCSVGVVVVRGGEVTDTFYRLIRPRPNFYSRFTTAIHGLTYEDTADAPDFASVWREIEPRIAGLPACLIPAIRSTAPAVPRAAPSGAVFRTTSCTPFPPPAASNSKTTTTRWPMPKRVRRSP